MKLIKWKQANPVDQLTSIRGAIDGNFSNWQDGIISPYVFGLRLANYLEEIRLLESFLAGKEAW